ncbi:MAG: cytosine permease [Acidimicrobiaceae bacterium]|nr:cytosine permease [Acidimicrobiaceae bacterium]
MVTTEQAPPSGQLFKVEQRGIDYIPEAERWARPRDMFGLWAGTSVQFEYFVYGAVLMTFGFTFYQGLAIILIGNVSYLLLGICSLQAPDAGTTAFMITRASFGTQGSRLLALFNWLTQVGFEIEGLTLIVLAAVALSAKSGFHAGTPAKVVFILAAAAIQGVLPFLGHATVVKVLRALIIPSLVIYAVLAGLTAHRVRVDHVHHGASWQVFMAGLAFSITLSGLGWVQSGNDFSRYLPASSSKKAVVGWIFLGTAVPQVLIMTLGAAVATYVTIDGGNPFASFPGAFAGWFLWPFLIVALLQLFAINSLDLYSSGVTLQALGLPVKRWMAVLIDTFIAGGVTFYAVFSSSFATLLADFAASVVAWIAPWMAIFLMDWALRGWRYAPDELQRTDRGGLYWYRGGVNWAAIISQALGTTASILAFSQNFFTGPIASATGGADFSVYTGIFVGGLSYLILAGPAIRRQRVEQDQLLAAPVAA